MPAENWDEAISLVLAAEQPIDRRLWLEQPSWITFVSQESHTGNETWTLDPGPQKDNTIRVTRSWDRPGSSSNPGETVYARISYYDPALDGASPYQHFMERYVRMSASAVASADQTLSAESFRVAAHYFANASSWLEHASNEMQKSINEINDENGLKGSAADALADAFDVSKFEFDTVNADLTVGTGGRWSELLERNADSIGTFNQNVRTAWSTFWYNPSYNPGNLISHVLGQIAAQVQAFQDSMRGGGRGSESRGRGNGADAGEGGGGGGGPAGSWVMNFEIAGQWVQADIFKPDGYQTLDKAMKDHVRNGIAQLDLDIRSALSNLNRTMLDVSSGMSLMTPVGPPPDAGLGPDGVEQDAKGLLDDLGDQAGADLDPDAVPGGGPGGGGGANATFGGALDKGPATDFGSVPDSSFGSSPDASFGGGPATEFGAVPDASFSGGPDASFSGGPGGSFGGGPGASFGGGSGIDPDVLLGGGPGTAQDPSGPSAGFSGPSAGFSGPGGVFPGVPGFGSGARSGADDGGAGRGSTAQIDGLDDFVDGGASPGSASASLPDFGSAVPGIGLPDTGDSTVPDVAPVDPGQFDVPGSTFPTASFDGGPATSIGGIPGTDFDAGPGSSIAGAPTADFDAGPGASFGSGPGSGAGGGAGVDFGSVGGPGDVGFGYGPAGEGTPIGDLAPGGAGTSGGSSAGGGVPETGASLGVGPIGTPGGEQAPGYSLFSGTPGTDLTATNPAQAGLVTNGNAAPGAGGGMPPMMPPMAPPGTGGQGQENERERTTWLDEDEEVWGTELDLAPEVIGRDDHDEPATERPYEQPGTPVRPHTPARGGGRATGRG